MNVDEYTNTLSQSNYMKAADVKQGDVVIIQQITMEKVKDFNTDEEVDAMVLHFSGGYKPYILRTKENIKMLRAFFGAETDSWIEREVELYTEPTKLGHGVRFRIPDMGKSAHPK